MQRWKLKFPVESKLEVYNKALYQQLLQEKKKQTTKLPFFLIYIFLYEKPTFSQ